MPKNTAAGPKRFWKSFRYAAQGIALTFRNELNMRVHSGVAVIVLVMAALFKVSPGDWMLLLLAITLVLSAELMNTAVESVVDFVSPDIHPLAKAAKDAAAGAVLLTAVFAVLAGLYVFYHPVMDWITGFMS
ncbi:diacylglycerol kinase family protein [Paenibacillus sp. HN-1]|uniref:diacylglycerol kinase family protein n=1 Tax=Paenibacillus TaxID=44249 RepID=UPI001CA8CC7F|nr:MULTISPECIES: diacylglycerol kinase family protein [Paenibacillus]MBY9076915.1 diacylglycerol kinase family protein [Paenibacillus sp. CGMCC 1.18879]MBY9086180.1 diacylglycerol kinase family protein [Paenibacillus sinensis]